MTLFTAGVPISADFSTYTVGTRLGPDFRLRTHEAVFTDVLGEELYIGNPGGLVVSSRGLWLSLPPNAGTGYFKINIGSNSSLSITKFDGNSDDAQSIPGGFDTPDGFDGTDFNFAVNLTGARFLKFTRSNNETTISNAAIGQLL